MDDPILAPCLWLNGQAEEAAAFYVETFGDGRLLTSARFPRSVDNPSISFFVRVESPA